LQQNAISFNSKSEHRLLLQINITINCHQNFSAYNIVMQRYRYSRTTTAVPNKLSDSQTSSRFLHTKENMSNKRLLESHQKMPRTKACNFLL